MRGVQLIRRLLVGAPLIRLAVTRHLLRKGEGFVWRIFLALLQHPREPSPDHRLHHREVVAAELFRLHVEFAVLVLGEAFRPRDDHRAKGVGALDVAVVVNFDTLRPLRKAEHLCNAI